jgi:septal ring factor EnvC (AmiA/AmiB activator)
MIARVWVSVAAVLLLAGVAVRAQDEAPATARRHVAPKPQASMSDEDRALLRQLSDAQRALGEQLQNVRDRVDAVQNQLSSSRDQDQAAEQEVKGLRDEVKGLYVELSGVKQQIDGLKEDVGGVNSNVSAFRTFSGFFIALMILLLAVIFVLTIRR